MADDTRCPYCDYDAHGDLNEEVAHMRRQHPEVIRKRLVDAGMSAEAEAFDREIEAQP